MKNINIIYKKIDELKPYKNNPRKNDKAVKAVADSIKEFGFKVPIILDSNMEIIAGHTRLKAAIKLKYKEVPCIIADDLTPDQARAFRLVDNKVGELAEWDIDLLNIELSEIEFDLTPFDFKIEKTVNDIEEDDYEVVEPDEPKAKMGDIYQLGKHRLMCGDSTSKEDAEKLMNGRLADLCLTDPPYNVNYEGSNGLTIKNDHMEDDKFNEFLYNFYLRMKESLKNGSLERAGLQLRQTLIWVKNSIILGRQDYQWQHEPILYGWKDGASHYFVNDRTQPTVIEDRININKLSKEKMKELLKEIYSDKIHTTIIHEDKATKNDVHPTMKPLKLCGRLLTNSSRPGDLVVDFFGGSGSTMMACEQIDRECYTMEYDPKYVDVIIDRWEKYTGRKAVKVE